MKTVGFPAIFVGAAAFAPIVAGATTAAFEGSATAFFSSTEKELWEVFLPSFLAIVFAGLVIAIVNYCFLRQMQKQNQNFLKEQRQRDVADLYFSNLEEQIIDYFKESSQEKAKILDAKTYAYIETFIVFLSQSKAYTAIEKELDGEFSILLDLDNSEVLDEEARLRRSLKSVATIRYLLAK